MMHFPLQLMYWEHSGAFLCGVMIQPVDDEGLEYDPVFMIQTPEEFLRPCQTCSLVQPHVHPAIEAFEYDGEEHWILPARSTQPWKPANPRGWMVRKTN